METAVDLPLEPCTPVETTPVGQQILQAASRLFYAHGITATGVDRIVEDAGTTKRTLYQRFGSKDALVAAYLQNRAHRWQTELLQAIDDADPAEGLDIVYDCAASWAEAGGRGCAFVNAWAEISAADHQALTAIREEKTWMLTLLTHLAGGDTSRGQILHLLYEGAQVDAAIGISPDAFATARATSHQILQHRS
ncbi:TetR/AcrR family transcriptional regulator [Brevibacterium luteolum]|uniref:TetR/AcrR family transcriptional regulator n=1 Tax=Brevibacterium luteolum TaxID=199591 RepID=A0A6G8KXE0_9MICO|nr:TetR/AcrR family transcriptional regulator [Brevibacterium luteolum]